jgi:hypothetical protein
VLIRLKQYELFIHIPVNAGNHNEVTIIPINAKYKAMYSPK